MQGPERWHCAPCGHDYPVEEGIPLLAILDEEPAGGRIDGRLAAASYQRNYQKSGPALDYNESYETKRLKRWSTRREFHLLQRLLALQPRCRTLLDLPCGGGRLSVPMGEHTDWLLEADVAIGQVNYGRLHRQVETPRSWFTASAGHIPLPDASVDGVVCVRLCHHLPEKPEREKLVAELLRVASRFVIMTFFDYHSLKNLLRRMTRPFNHKPPKMTMTVEEVRSLAQRHGARLTEYPALSFVGSGHRYALMVKS